MSVRYFIASVVFLAAPVAAAAADPTAEPTAVTTSDAQAQPRRPERAKPLPAPPLRRRTIEAPGAALMLIPASYTPR